MKITPDVLRPHPLLALLPYRTLKRLAADSAVAEYPKGTVLFREGEKCDALYLIISGRCEARAAGKPNTRVVEGVFGPGDIIGERAFLHAEPHAYTAIVVTHCVLIRIPAEELDQLFIKDKRLAARFSQLLAKRWSVLQSWASGSGKAVRRVVSLVALNPNHPAAVLAERIAGAVADVSAARVLMLRLETDRTKTPVHDWALKEPRLEAEFSFTHQVRRGSRVFDEFALPVGEDERYAAAIAPLISHCSRHYDYVVLQPDSSIPARVLGEIVVQADLTYVVIEPVEKQIYDFELLLRSLGLGSEATQHVRPVVIGEDRDGLIQCAEAFQRQVRTAHFFPTRLPSSESGSEGDARLAMYIRRIAREIARCRVGLALSSGGAKGLAHVGVIQVLEENGIEIDAIAGSSMGAYVASLWATGLNGKQLEVIAREHEGRWGLSLIMDPVFPPRQGFIRTGRIARRLRRGLKTVNFAELVRPLRVVATRLSTLERTVFSRGEVAQAVEASIAIPGIFVPVSIGPETYVDGGVSDPLPVDVLEEMGIERIIAVNAIPTAEQLGSWLEGERQAQAGATGWSLRRWVNKHLNYFASGNVFDTMIQAFVGAQMLVAESATRRADIVLRPVECDAWWHDFSHPGRYIALGRRVAEEALSQLLALAKPNPAHETPPLSKRPLARPPSLRAA